MVESEELQIDGFSHNPTNRCYLCKKELFTKIWDIAKEYDIPYVAEASNLDDNGDYRPGLMAVAELSVLIPCRKPQPVGEFADHALVHPHLAQRTKHRGFCKDVRR